MRRETEEDQKTVECDSMIKSYWADGKYHGLRSVEKSEHQLGYLMMIMLTSVKCVQVLNVEKQYHTHESKNWFCEIF